MSATATRTAKEQQVLIGKKKTTLHVRHAFFYMSSPSMHAYKVKLPIFTLCGGREHN